MAKAGNGRDAFDDALRRRLGAAPLAPGPECLDAEMLAAFYERTLDREGRARCEAHLADCARCEAALGALARADVPAAGAPGRWAWTWVPGWRIAVPALAAALVVAVAVARMRSNVAIAPPEQLASARGEVHRAQEAAPMAPSGAAGAAGGSRAASAPAAVPAAKAQSRATPPHRMAALAKEKTTVRETFASASGLAASAPTVGNAIVAEGAPAGTGAPIAAPAVGAAMGGTVGMAAGAHPFIVRAPDGIARWHVRSGDQIDYTPDGVNFYGSTTGVAAPLTSGSAPTTSVCWMVGRAGTVIRTTDGTHWTKLASPTPSDLTRITAENADVATVYASDGRAWATADGGRTWSLK
jgi:hypothetical protein